MYQKRFDLHGKIAAITGGARGIGLEIARAFIDMGAKVVLLDLDPEVGSAQAQELGSSASFKQLNVTQPEAVRFVAEQIEKEHGRIDILVNSAGISKITPSFETPDQVWRDMLDVNLLGSFWCCREFGRVMSRHNGGSIINMGSMSGEIVNRPQAPAAYCASKAGVHLMTKSLACEWVPHNIRVNALAPGYIATDMTLAGRAQPELFDEWMKATPMGRCGNPDEVASAAVFLASDASSYINGSIMAVDGGYTAW